MRKPGFTLVEVLVSITLIAIALLGVMGSIAYGTKNAAHGAELTEATHLARSNLNYIQEGSLLDLEQIDRPWPNQDSGLADSPSTFRQLDAPPLPTKLFLGTQLERYRRRIESHRVVDDPLNYRYKLAKVRVSVFWSTKQGERNVSLMGLVSITRD